MGLEPLCGLPDARPPDFDGAIKPCTIPVSEGWQSG